MDPLLVLSFIVNGEEVKLETPFNVRLEDVLRRVLEQSRNTARPVEEWELRTEEGILIPHFDKFVGELGFKNCMKLYLTLKVGAGGYVPRRAC